MFNTFLLNFIDDSLIIGHRHRELLRKPTRVRNICIQSIDYCIRIPLYISYRLRLVFVDSQTQLFYFPIETISKLHYLRRSPGTHFGVLLAHTSAFSWYTLRRSPGTHLGVLLAHTSAFSWYTLRRSPGTHFGVLLVHTSAFSWHTLVQLL